MSPKRILVIQTAFIGDVILATSLIETLHQEHQDAQIDFLVRKGNEGLLENHPYLRNVLIWKKKEEKFKSLWQLLKKIRKENYDWVINLQRFGSTGILTGFSGSAVRVGFDKNPFSFLFTHKAIHNIQNGVHEIRRNYALLNGLVSKPCSKPKLHPSPDDFLAVQVYQQTPYICIAPSSVWFTKQYPPEGWIDLINKIPENYRIYLLGAPTDKDLGDFIKNTSDIPAKTENLCGKLTFLQSAALIKSARMNFVNDSAPMHISSAMNAPVTAVFCSTIPEFGFGPLSDSSHLVEILEKLYCRPCGLHGYKKCPEGHFRCAKEISTSQFLEVLK